jgi:hypothetical protein
VRCVPRCGHRRRPGHGERALCGIHHVLYGGRRGWRLRTRRRRCPFPSSPLPLPPHLGAPHADGRTPPCPCRFGVLPRRVRRHLLRPRGPVHRGQRRLPPDLLGLLWPRGVLPVPHGARRTRGAKGGLDPPCQTPRSCRSSLSARPTRGTRGPRARAPLEALGRETTTAAACGGRHGVPR